MTAVLHVIAQLFVIFALLNITVHLAGYSRRAWRFWREAIRQNVSTTRYANETVYLALAALYLLVQAVAAIRELFA